MRRILLVAAVALLLGAAGARAASRTTRPLLGVASGRYLAHDPGRLSVLDAGWAYDWSATHPPGWRGPSWVPMVWGGGSVTPASLRALTAERRAGRISDLLGFNEPDSAGQSNLTPEQAAALWPSLQRTGLRLGSPAPATPSDGWLARFMAIARARRLRVDFIALHFYPDVTAPGAVAGLRAQLVAVHRAYGLPIWITELGAFDLRAWGEPMAGTIDPAAVSRFMRAADVMLDRLGFVRRVAWFTDQCSGDAACRDSSLFDAGGRLSPAGETFRSLAAG